MGESLSLSVFISACLFFLFRDCLAFCTEPVFASLANVLGQWDNLPSPVPTDIKEHKLFDVETKYGLLQVRQQRRTSGTHSLIPYLSFEGAVVHFFSLLFLTCTCCENGRLDFKQDSAVAPVGFQTKSPRMLIPLTKYITFKLIYSFTCF